MASSGSFNTTGYEGRYLTFEWSVQSQDIASNTTVIAWTLKGAGNAVSGYYLTQNIKVTINGAIVYSKPKSEGQIQLRNGTVVATGTHTLTHNDEGNCSFSAYAEAGIYLWDVNCTGSGNFDLPQILRASVPTLSANSVNFGSNITIYTNRKSSGFTHHLYYSVNGGAEVGITDGIGDSYTWAVPYDLMSNIPSAKSATVMFRLYTFSGGTNIGNNTISFTATVPANSNTLPSVSMTLSPVGSLPAAFSGLYIQSKTKVKAALSATGKHGATIRSYSMNIDGSNYGSSQAYTSGFLSKYGTFAVTGSATDSRGNTNTVVQNIEVIPYSSPKIQDVQAVRCDADGHASDTGTYLKISAKRSYSKIVSGNVQKNFCEIRYRYKLAAASSYSAWTTILAKTSGSDEVTTAALLNGALSIQSSYVVQVQAIDDIGENSYTTITIPTEKVFSHRDGARNSITYGGYIEEDNTFTIAEGMKFKVKSEEWISLGLSAAVSEPEYAYGRAEGTGCHYRVVNGNHVFVAFNCAFTHSGMAITINAAALPTVLRPPRNVYALCPIGSTALARVRANASGNILVDWVQMLNTGETTSSMDVQWIDGYIDFFV